MIKNISKNLKLFFKIGILLSLFFISSQNVYATTEVYFEGAKEQIKEGDSFIVKLMIFPSKESINTIDGTITYDIEKLKIEKVKKTNSFLTLWIKEPDFDNKKGELVFVGGIPNGFSEKSGEVLEITFKAKKSGKTVIGFKDIFYVFLNDGQGTTINPWLKPMSLSIEESKFVSENIFNPKEGFKYYISISIFVILFLVVLLIRLKKRNVK